MTTINEASYETRISLLETQLREFIAEQRAQNAYVNAFIVQQRDHNTRVDAFITDQQAHNANTDAFIAEQRQFNAEQRQINANHAARMDRMQNDISTLLAAHGENKAAIQAKGIAYDMGYRLVRTLSHDDLLELHQRHDPTGTTGKAILRSFRNADLVIEAQDDAGEIHYIAVEASHTADQRDTDRAIRNASLLTWFTGRPAHPAIVSARNDHHAQALVDSRQIYHHPAEE